MNDAMLTVDLGFGDAGKGSVVDYLTRRYDAHTVVRYNGGAQAGHRVVTPDGQSHVFSQFGSGSLAGARTHLSRFVLLDPLALLAEAAHLYTLGQTDIFARVTIDADALVVTPFQRAINRLRELARGAARHGSCGMGIGETMSDALQHGAQVLRAGDLKDPAQVRAKLHFLRTQNLAKLEGFADQLVHTAQTAEELAVLTDEGWIDWLTAEYTDFGQRVPIVPNDFLPNLLHRAGTVIFEGAQGVLLDERYGFHPHTTWSTTTLANADQLLAEASYSGEVARLGILRSYTTRHGAGPLPTEDATLTQALPDPANKYGDWQAGFRVGWLDLVLMRYAKDVVGKLDGLAVTCLDRIADLPVVQVCQCYTTVQHTIKHIPLSPIEPNLDHQTALTQLLYGCTPRYQPLAPAQLPATIAAHIGVPVMLASYGETADDKTLMVEFATAQPVAS